MSAIEFVFSKTKRERGSEVVLFRFGSPRDGKPGRSCSRGWNGSDLLRQREEVGGGGEL